MERSETVKDTENNIKVNAVDTEESAGTEANSPQNPVNEPGTSTAASEGFSASILPSDDGGTKIKVVIRDTDQPNSTESALPQVGGDYSREAVTEKDKQRELSNRKREYKKKRQASRGMVNLGSPIQESSANVLPEDLSEGQQPKANRLMRRSKNRGDNSTVRTGQIIPEYSSGLSGLRDLDDSLSDQEDSDENEDTGNEQPLNISEDEENDTEQQLNEQRNESKNEDDNESGPTDLIAIEQARVTAQRKKVEKLDKENSAAKRTLIMLFTVLAVAISKDLFDIIAEALSIGVWSWLDWMLDLPLLIAAFVLKIEKPGDGRAKVIGWAINSVELIPYIDMLPAWTMRVVLAIINRNKEIADLSKRRKEEEKKLNKSIQALLALYNLPDSK
ncbi:MAG: hypothetical protein WC693_07110 [Patescibacteria group bacterium]|jgi:hypothetical protein